ncbi:MAG TPA: hypothetical protein VEU47_00450 [Candidatus Cybelea sp.]|nr:hypothetical protein [Candidatus Cybelea sp.]
MSRLVGSYNALKGLVAAAAVGGALLATPALAWDRDRDRHDWDDHGWRHHERVVEYYPAPAYYYGPPPVYYAPPRPVYVVPPPVYYAPPPSLSIVVPLRIR